MTAELARFSLGRVLLHLIAMLGDRAVRFHAAGIARELSWVAGAAALLAQVRTRMAALPRRHYRLHVEACRLRQEQQPGVR
jgi:hypothetical protein